MNRLGSLAIECEQLPSFYTAEAASDNAAYHAELSETPRAVFECEICGSWHTFQPDLCFAGGRVGGRLAYPTQAVALGAYRGKGEPEAFHCRHCRQWHLVDPRTKPASGSC